MPSAVLDSSAILAVVYREAGRNETLAYLTHGHCSANNLAEVITKLVELGTGRVQLERIIGSLSLEIHPVTANDAIEIGLLRAPTRAAGLSLGDRSCLALAARLGLPAVTTDRAWAKVAEAVGVEVRVIR